jgi:hypothetical protein
MKDFLRVGFLLMVAIVFGWACLAVSELVSPASQQEIQADGQ